MAFKTKDPTKLSPLRLIRCTEYLLQKGRAAEEMFLESVGEAGVGMVLHKNRFDVQGGGCEETG